MTILAVIYALALFAAWVVAFAEVGIIVAGVVAAFRGDVDLLRRLFVRFDRVWSVGLALVWIVTLSGWPFKDLGENLAGLACCIAGTWLWWNNGDHRRRAQRIYARVVERGRRLVIAPIPAGVPA